MIVLKQFTLAEKNCTYLPGHRSRMEYVLVGQLDPAEYEGLMNAGWRKFGIALFHPVCASCRECRPIRVLVDRFTPDRSQRRNLQRNSDLDVRINPPEVDPERLALFNRYHRSQALLKGWPKTSRLPEHYASSFIRNPIEGLEISVRQDGILRAVSLTEITPNVVSGVYHYHDPDCRERGLGTYVMLQTIEAARRLGKPYAYFGYYVEGCADMTYKARFNPCEILGVDGIWRDSNS